MVQDFHFDVRIPAVLIEQMMQGEITCAMLVTMTILYKWSNWSTGTVRAVCASSLHLASHKAYSEKTFQESLKRLEEIGWITRQMTLGSHKWYPVTIHNYKFVDDAGKIHILNPKEIKSYLQSEQVRCGEASGEASDGASNETSGEGSDEASDRHESLLKSKHQSSNESELESEHDQSKKESKQASPSLPSVATAPSGTALASRENQSPSGLGTTANQDQKQNQPQTVDEFWSDDSINYEAKSLLLKLRPKLTDAVVQKQGPLCERILTFFDEYGDNRGFAAEAVLDWNHAHRSGKYASKDDKKLYIRSANQYLAALESPNANLLNDYHTHEFANCDMCKAQGTLHVGETIAEAVRKNQARAEAARQAEIDRTICAYCKQKPFGQMTLFSDTLNRMFPVCDDCYDQAYEAKGTRRALTGSAKISEKGQYLISPTSKAQAIIRPRQGHVVSQHLNLIAGVQH